jgi:hypothetical protein
VAARRSSSCSRRALAWESISPILLKSIVRVLRG